jgi:DNA-binding IclR family transcriptional regulator
VIAAMNVCAHASRVSAERMLEEFLPPLLHAAATVDKHTRSKG